MRLGRQASECDNVALVEVCGSTVEKGGVAGDEFIADGTFSQWVWSLITVCSSLRSLLCLFEIMQAKIQGNLGDFVAQNYISVSKCSFRKFRPFSVIAENHWPYVWFLCVRKDII